MNDPTWFPWVVRIGAIVFVAIIFWFVWKMTKLHSKGNELAGTTSAAVAKPSQPAYSYGQMMQDLSDKRLSIDEILDRCNGQLPKELADAIAGKMCETSPPPTSQSRETSRLSWFEMLAKGVPNYKVVHPPSQGPPAVTVKGWVVLCFCRRGGGSISTMIQPMYGPPPRYSPGVRCHACQEHRDNRKIITGSQ